MNYKTISELTLPDLLSITIREPPETANQLLNQFTLRDLAQALPEEIQKAVKGIGPKKAQQIVSAIELGRRLYSAPTEIRPVIKSPADVYDLLKGEMQLLDKENFRSILLDTKHNLITVDTVSVGTLNSSLVHPRELFKPAIKRSAAALILVHNHPSFSNGNPQPAPSPEDITITKRLKEAGELLGIEVIDHIIIGDAGFYSFKEHGNI